MAPNTLTFEDAGSKVVFGVGVTGRPTRLPTEYGCGCACCATAGLATRLAVTIVAQSRSAARAIGTFLQVANAGKPSLPIPGAGLNWLSMCFHSARENA